MSDIKRFETSARMSMAVVHNGVAYLAGQVGEPTKDISGQTQDCLDRVEALLAQVGTDKSRILSAQIWLADMADFAAMNAVWDAWVPRGSAPARATGEAKLATPDYKVEVIVTAAV
ncbi:RidA family protein [Paracoccus suum]|uniref:RidA family protein n=1 Tax=Paracoccus suum TaxID=2259340 RepID=A0A344PPF7_9RHOB|nr:RidA family protein [Paracoccus suum]AXC51262.1 RidA family protein [Paracoccus suum]